MKNKAKILVNQFFSRFGLRVVNCDWGPRGFMATFNKLKQEKMNPKEIYDVGASNGSWSLELEQLFPDSNYTLFEPLTEHRKELSALASRKENFSFCDVALGSEVGECYFNTHEGQSSFLESTQWKGEKTKVVVSTIDEMVRAGKAPSPNLIKADIQGYELEMLKGAEKALHSCDFIFLELSWLQIYKDGPYAGEILGYLDRKGFKVFDICTYSLRPLDDRLTQSDVLFAHERTGLFANKRWANS